MKYYEILKAIESSDAEDWKVTRTHDGRSVAFHREYVDVRIVSSLGAEHSQNESYHAEWANKNADKSASGHYFDLYFGATLLHQFVLVSVDGHRCLLPQPNVGEMIVPLLTYKVAEIFDQGTLIDYFHRAGFKLGTFEIPV